MSDNINEIYSSLLYDVLYNGKETENRTGVNAISKFGYMFCVNIEKDFPLLTTKKIHFKSVAVELLWFISGNSNIKFLQENGVRIWNEWADENGDLGPVYPELWRNNNGVDQLGYCIDELKTNSLNRRLIVNSWRPDLLPDNSKSFSENIKNGKQALPPCHYSFQFNSDGAYLDLMWNQRSVDVFLGLPFNIASYALLLKMVAHLTNLKPRNLIASLGNCHVYVNHKKQSEELLQRDCFKYKLPSLELNPLINSIDDFTLTDIYLIGYNSYDTIKAKVAV